MKILIVGHTGFLGRNLLSLLNEAYPHTYVFGISKTFIDVKKYPRLRIFESINFDCKLWDSFDFIFFLAHAQNSKNVLESEAKLAYDFSNLVKKNKFSGKVVLIRSIGGKTKHILSRQRFNDYIIKEFPNKVVEINLSIVVGDGSTPYEIPKRLLKRLPVLPSYPWMNNKVSLVSITGVIKEFKKIIDGRISLKSIIPKHHTTTYKSYIIDISNELGKKVRFIPIPFNDLYIAPFFVSVITGYPKYLVLNLMKSLRYNSVLDNKKRKSRS